jgi:hypothetical protein
VTGRLSRRPAPGRPTLPTRAARARLRPLAAGATLLDRAGLLGAWEERNRRATIDHCVARLESSGKLENLRRLRDRDAGAFCGLWFADSDIHKVLEAIGWETGRAGDGGWMEFVDETVALMRDAQDEDGYLNYTQTGERMARVAAGGVRLVVDELRTDVTTTRKDGSRGRLRMDYGDHRDPQVAIAWSWKFVVCRVAGYAESAVRDGAADPQTT